MDVAEKSGKVVLLFLELLYQSLAFFEKVFLLSNRLREREEGWSEKERKILTKSFFSLISFEASEYFAISSWKV
jgi:hypothetical protein